LKRFAGFEFYDISALNLDLSAGLWIATFAGFAVDFPKSAESDQRHLPISFF
jgi:hypothetical protein